MPERIMPGVRLRAFYDPGQRNWGTSLSEDLRRLSLLVQARAVEARRHREFRHAPAAGTDRAGPADGNGGGERGV